MRILFFKIPDTFCAEIEKRLIDNEALLEMFDVLIHIMKISPAEKARECSARSTIVLTPMSPKHAQSQQNLDETEFY